MPQKRPSLITEAAALAVAGVGLHRYEMGPAVIGAGVDVTVVIVESGDDPGVGGVQDATKVLLRGDAVPALRPRLEIRAPWPLHVFVRLDGGCLPLGTALCRGGSSIPAHLPYALLKLDKPLTREVLDAVRPVPEPGPVPGVDWVGHVESDPIRALEAFVLGWFPAEAAGSIGERTNEGEQPDDLPEALTAFYSVARRRPAVLGFRNPVLPQPQRTSGPLGGRLVFAVDAEGIRDWSVAWPSKTKTSGEDDPRVWLTEDPSTDDPETSPEEEPLSRFLLQYTLYEAMNIAPYQARTYCMPTPCLAPLRSVLRPVPLSPFLPAYTGERFFAAPGLLAAISSDEKEAVVTFAALHRATLTPLLAHGYRWFHFDG
ncbi:hypothetical protein SAMN05216532_7961 [Streptomyces sp. 2231.1]|uniref:hypothetical protein n=1 Tax=Streptomyces sp. 2231.1 TaxID=1855347 RepID=UPI0008973D24|nr:hypothetical protein [Streptomyces sp. 2231.1]SEE37090.1 hypothetical protein SAMN05216532_7961 [Streptomyces sp. 2231.1]